MRGDELHGRKLRMGCSRTCKCPRNHLNCLSAKEWLKSQIGVWRFCVGSRDIRDKSVHPATFPISLAKRVVSLFTHAGELVLDPFGGSGTTLLAARDLNRNAIGIDLQETYVKLAARRLSDNPNMFNQAVQVVVHDDARNAAAYVEEESIALAWTSPPYANLLNKPRLNKSRRYVNLSKRGTVTPARHRRNAQFGKVEQYSQDERDLGTLDVNEYVAAMGDVFEGVLPMLRHGGHCVLNVMDIWTKKRRISLQSRLIGEMERRGYVLKNVIIWDKTNLVNAASIFGWPSNYIAMSVMFEYLLDFCRPPAQPSSRSSQ